jgi:2-amino-4-hydroxy-6-hydroxymethyldihydropteridine diphosphokinase
MIRAFVGLGSNLNDPLKQLQCAVKTLAQLPHCQVIAASSVYRSAPMGPGDQPDYYNAVLALETGLTAFELLDAMQEIETAQGRIRNAHWGPRTIDLDLLLFGDLQIDTQRLTVPHPEMHKRDFVLNPLEEICGGSMVLPNGLELDTLRVACTSNNLVKTDLRLQLSPST